jgi:hypothetical protein
LDARREGPIERCTKPHAMTCFRRIFMHDADRSSSAGRRIAWVEDGSFDPHIVQRLDVT